MKTAALSFFLSLTVAALAQEVSVSELFAPHAQLGMKPASAGAAKIERSGARWHVTGEAPLRIRFTAASEERWDLSKHRLAGLVVNNQGSGVVTLTGKLQNDKATDWSRNAPGFCVAPAGEESTLGFPFSMPEDGYTGPQVFKDQLGRPTGHRLHWRSFQPEDVRALLIELRSSTGKIDVLLGDLFAAWPASAELDARLNAMPYLDEMGQVRAVGWPGKAHSIDEARAALAKEYDAAAKATVSRRLSPYGGWLDGPKLRATGHFRTEKLEGKWWLVDPEGYLFFSVGVCLAGNQSEALVNPLRREKGFFAYIPKKEDPLQKVGAEWKNGRLLINYPSLNYARFLGGDWKERSRTGDLDRMKLWGLNTLGCWSQEAMQKEHRAAYTLIASSWWKGGKGDNAFPSPFSETFEATLRTSMQKQGWAKDDPWLLGVFLGNELEWPDQIGPMLFELEAGHPTKQWAIDKMRAKYGELAALNAAWKTQHQEWSAILGPQAPGEIAKPILEDLEPLYLEFATTFFKRCKSAVEAVFPGALYLGCRTHRGPKVLGRAAVGHVDVFSVNVYDSRVRAHQLPDDADMPVLSSEFHFGAVDRGVPSPGLVGVWDQKQRGLGFALYLASAVADPRFVGVHWFQWLDQNAAGRPDRENHAVGFLDVTGRAHSQFVETVSKATSHLYQARRGSQSSVEQTLEELLKPEVP